MKWTFATTGMIIMGLFGIVIIVLFHEITVSNEQDYYTLKEATEASMIEAVDTAYYRLTGKIKISEEKFVENFTKRFIKSSTFGQGNYYVDFYQIIEYPAKVSLRIVDDTNSYNIFTSLDESVGETQARIVNELSAILEGYEIDEEYSIVNYAFDYSTNSDAKPPTVSNGKQPVKPIKYRCPKWEEDKKSPATYVVSEPQYDVSNPNSPTCHYQVWLTASGDEGTFYTVGGIATITCPNGTKLGNAGWCYYQ